ncbi:MAG: alpha-2-macroglobulin family protein [Thermoanaerobaculia bacterium]
MRSSHRGLEALAVALVLAFGVACSESSGDALAAKPRAGEAGEIASRSDGDDTESLETMSDKWEEVDRLISEDKFEAASRLAAEIREAARQSGDDEDWTRAIIKEVQLRTALHGHETAVRFLRTETWPETPLYQAILELFYAQSLVSYTQIYSWEIEQRERFDTGDEIDLKSWTKQQIVEEAQKAYLEVWRQREVWGSESLGALGEYLEQNNYPARIRGTLRDAVTYLWVELLSDTSLWQPRQSNELYRLDLERLIAADPVGSAALELGDPAVHPLVKIGALLDDLESWHLESDRPEAAFEADRERLSRLHSSFTRGDDRAAIRAGLEKRLDALGRRYPWWSLGQATLADFVLADDAADSQVRARELALAGEQAHPGTIGGDRCRSIVAAIEAPGYSLQSMANDGPARRSIQVTHKNLGTLHFRAYALDLVEQIESSEDYNALPGYREIPEIIGSRLPDAEWSVELPATPDYRSHRTYVTPPMEQPGLYVVVASARRDFRQRVNREAAVNLIVTDLVLLTRQLDSTLEVTVRSGETGKGLERVQVSLYRFDYRKGHQRVETHLSGADGRVDFGARDADRYSYFVLAERGEDTAVDLSYQRFHRQGRPSEQTAALVYTDRSVYRPQQTIHWKVVAYRGGGEKSTFRTLPKTSMTVELMDPNWQVVESLAVATNGFGSASGEFEIPTGKLLGGWWIRTSLGGQIALRIEEYKRPTFEVTVTEPEGALRLNREASLAGEVRYYFGLPVVTGSVGWRVEREPVYPRWWYWWYGAPTVQSEIVAAGTTALDEEGRFRVSFVPSADERDASQGVTYRFRLHADVTDEGGETRAASRAFRLGFVAVETAVESGSTFFGAGKGIELAAVRTDLDGVPRAGEASWRLTTLEQPEETLLPAEQPIPARPEQGERYTTPGDLLRPRWETDVSAEQVLRQWQDGGEVLRGSLVHDDEGRTRILLPELEAGVYRLHYSTVDDFGAAFETTKEIVVVEEGRKTLALPALLMVERASVPVGETARLLVHSGLAGQDLVLEIYRGGHRIENRRLDSDQGVHIVEIPIGKEQRGGFGVRLTGVRDHQLMSLSGSVFVPWDDRELRVEFSSFRDRLRPGALETWRVKVTAADEAAVEAGAAEVLAYMYDRSLDLFAPHNPMSPLSLYPSWMGYGRVQTSLGWGSEIWQRGSFGSPPGYLVLHGDRLAFYSGYGIGGMGRGRYLAKGAAELRMDMAAPAPEGVEEEMVLADAQLAGEDKAFEEANEPQSETGSQPDSSAELRTDFSETAFWEPHLLIDDDGAATFEFTVPDSVTEWNVWLHAVTRDLRGGSLTRTTRSVKDLMVRPYLPRFLREGDRAAIKVVVNNAGDEDFSGRLDFEILDPETEESLVEEFGLSEAETVGVPFTVEAGGGANLTFPVEVPARVGTVAFKVVARAGDLSDGELRPLPLLPGRMHLSQSRFVTLRDADRRELHFADLAAGDDPTLVNEQLVVTLDAQLFYSVLHALPYLVDYPYECTEQVLNRFLSTGIVSALYDDYPAVARMAKEFSARETRYETWDAVDPNRKMALEETPWLISAKGGREPADNLVRVLDPRVARAERSSALAKLEKAQTSLGGFPWWPGGPPSPYMTLYILQGFSRALEFGVEVPQEVVVEAWSYMHRHYLDEIVRQMMSRDCCWEMVTFLNYVLSSYPDDSWTGGVFTTEERKQMLDFSFRHWRQHSPLLKAYLALTLERSGRSDDAVLVFDSVMDSAKTTQDEGTFWAPEDRSWLWYNDTIETHSFALRTLTELEPDDARRHGLVQWLLLNKKLSHWKSTRATAEVIYALIHYLEREGALGVREEATVVIGPETRNFVFEPDEYTGAKNQIVVAGGKIDPETMSTIVVEKETKGFMFASATWHFSTEKLPAEARGDFFSVTRRYFKRVGAGDEWILQPLEDGAALAPGDQVEVHLSLRTKHAAEYIHLRDPRGAGFEPESTTSSYKWDLGIGWYEEIRDSGTNFFFEWLPVGEYTFKYRLRANMAGTFKVAPATLQSMYAPEFTAYSAGAVVEID